MLHFARMENQINQSMHPPKNLKVNYWMISTVFLFIILLAGSGWLILNSINKTMITGVVRTSGLNDAEGSISEDAWIKILVTKFEKYIQDRNVQGLISLYTPAKTTKEIASYHNLMGKDPDIGIPRLFNNVTSNFIVTSWKIARREYPDNKELITKDGNKYFVVVEETRKGWCNAGPCVGTYSFENKATYIFEIVNSNSQLLVDRYYLMNQNNGRNGGSKYEGLNF